MNTAVIERTIDIPESREVRFTLPETVPNGQAYITVTYTPKVVTRKPWVNPLLGRGKKLGYKSTLERFMQQKNEDRVLEMETDERNGGKQTVIEALRKEAAQKAALRFSDPSGDALQRFCGSLAHIYTEDGVVIQRRMRNEWER
jgi:hypothetical protein